MNPFLFLLFTSIIDFIITVNGVFFMGKAEGTYPINLLISTYGIIGYFLTSLIYLLTILYIYRYYDNKYSHTLFIILASFHFAGIFTWINMYSGYAIGHPYLYFLISLSSPISFLLGRRF